MQALIMATIIAVVSFGYLTQNGWAPRMLNYAPEILALIAAALVVVVGVRSRFRYVRPVYWLIFGGLGVVALCGALVNMLEPGTAFAALRTYLRALPLFFLPAVIALEDRQLKRQLLLLVAVCVIQLPIAWQQRMATAAIGWTTGDLTVGTLLNSATLTMFLVSAACVLTAFFIKKRLPARYFFPLLLLVLAPTMINETKGVLVLLPLAFLATAIIGSRRGTRLKNTVLSLGVIACFTAAFIPVYDHFIEPRWGYGLVEFLTREGRVEEYLDRGTEVGEYDRTAGKVGGPIAAARIIARDPTTLVFGLGIGSISDSSLGEQFSGRYVNIYAPLIENSLGHLIFEIGFAGVGLLLLLFLVVLKDTLYVARTDSGMMGAFAVGWSGVVVVMGVGVVYHNILDVISLTVLFWYFSGVVAAHRMRMSFDAVPVPAASRARPAYPHAPPETSGATA